MLTVVTPATSFLLTTIERARSVLGFAASDDVAMETAIRQASRTAADYCRRPFGIETLRQRVEHGCEAVVLARSPVRSIASVTIGDEDLAADEFAIDATTGSLIRLDAEGRPTTWWSGPTITYDAGFQLPTDDDDGDLPDPVERAAIVLAQGYRAGGGRDPMIKTQEVPGLGSTSWYVPGAADVILIPEVEQLLAPYRRLWP